VSGSAAGERAAPAGGAPGRVWVSRSAEWTERAGETLAPALRAGDVIALRGPLGAGKTRLIAGLARGLECAAVARSPTFTLVNEYHGRITLAHVDLYRVDAGEVDSLGLDDVIDRAALAVEWAEKLPERFLVEALELELAIASAAERRIAAAARPGGRGSELLAAWGAVIDAIASRGA
jgi:tRNA threonylcarbamoyl adenosine modification protein YjeE